MHSATKLKKGALAAARVTEQRQMGLDVEHGQG